jgi:predicted dehydrogenase
MSQRSPISSLSRRSFLKTSAACVATVAIGDRAWASAGEEVRVAVLGAGVRGGEVSAALHSARGACVVSVADPDSIRGEKLAAKHKAAAVGDLRRVLDDPNVDAVVITTPNHWHCLAAMWAIDAGKDVYVEKPLSHSQWEGRQLVNAAKRSGRVVQIGTQQRSDPMQAEVKRFLHEDRALGAIRFAQANRLGPRGSIGLRETPLVPPDSVDYNLWLGPAQDLPIYRNQFHYDWHWDFNTGSGEMGNWGVHVLDDVRNVAYQDAVSTPARIVAAGGRVGWHDAGSTPNVHYALFETDTFPTLIALSNLPKSPTEKGGWKARVAMPFDGPGTGYLIACEGGYYLGQRGHGRAVDLSGQTIREFKGGDMMALHVQNFVDAVASGDPGSLNAPVEMGHHSTGWCNLANIAVQAGSAYDSQRLASAGSLDAWPELIEAMERQLAPHGATTADLVASPVLHHDPVAERFVGENAEAANRFLRRDYRAGFEVAEVS